MNKKKNRGMTMVEILVAFVVLVLVMAILYGCMQFASKLMMEATDIDRSNALYQKAVSDMFSSPEDYKLGTSGMVTYTFKSDAVSGGATSTYDFSVYTAKVTFKENAGGYTITGDDTEPGTRNLYLFSTGE